MENLQADITKLNQWFQEHPKVLIALSGGVDSCLVAFMARQQLGKNNAIAVISNSASLKQKDLLDARIFADTYDIELVEIDANEIEDINYSSNPVNRCYYCKSNLYNAIQKLLSKYPDFEIINGNNYDDTGDYRPGMKAANEFSVRSPLLECKITKESIRNISKHYKLTVWDKPASPCLSSRFPYGEHITRERLSMVENAENLINKHGFKDVRVRYKNGGASIEVPQKELGLLNKQLSYVIPKLITEYGFSSVKIDNEGLVSGKLNRDIKTDNADN
ncbi:ATP-dependent sacrificial sulfur transferase LarE [Labilibacter marinus]|uniref:ATP-dependent sacrificial sulfur transferase LarE n=1 Tax=Labilibacter marinus TaxID=1477105 RepID=UPI00082E00CB|nr:ATP-dependent sacrificial sulfur transferase LarE [Labilibacter marinus]